MNRRSFLKFLGVGIPSTVVAIGLGGMTKVMVDPPSTPPLVKPPELEQAKPKIQYMGFGGSCGGFVTTKDFEWKDA